MKYAIDETELARLEALAGKASTLPFEDMAADGWGYVVVDILPAVTAAVPALVAEVRRLREALNKEHRAWQCAEGRGDGLEMENAALREKVEAWEWLVDVEGLFRHSLYRKSYWRWRSGAYDELAQSLIAAREAVHADRE